MLRKPNHWGGQWGRTNTWDLRMLGGQQVEDAENST